MDSSADPALVAEAMMLPGEGYLAEQMDLSVFEPHADGLSTYGDKGARLDWILISSELEFSMYAVFPDVVSDHYAVAAEITPKQ